MNSGRQEPAPKEKPAILRTWQNRNFALFMAGIGPFYITGWMQRVGIGWLAWELSRSPAWLGIIAAADLAPMLFLAPIAGALVDRWNPVTIIRLCMNLMTVQAVLLTILTFSGAISIEILFLLALFTGLILPFYTACRQVIVATSVPRSDFASAIATDSSFYHGSRFVGPAIAGIVIQLWGVGATFIAHIFGTLLFFAVQSMMDLKPTSRPPKVRTSMREEIREGVVYVARHRGIAPIFLLMMITSLAVRPLQDMLPGFAGDVFKTGPEGLAWLASAMGVGALTSALTIATRGTVTGLTRLSIIGCLVLALATYAFSAASHFWLAVIAAAFVGVSLNGMATSCHTLIQNAVSDDIRGRVTSLYSLIYRGVPALGAVSIGFLAEKIGLQQSFTIAAAVCLVTWLAIVPYTRRMAEALEIRK